MNELRKTFELFLAEYMGSENAKNLDKFGTPENKLVNQLIVAVKEQTGEPEEHYGINEELELKGGYDL